MSHKKEYQRACILLLFNYRLGKKQIFRYIGKLSEKELKDLFSKIEFEIPNPVYLIEFYCNQSGFYFQYDAIENRKIEDVNKIGARLKSKTISDCKAIGEGTRGLDIFQNTLDQFLDLDELKREKQVKELNNVIFQNLLKIKGISFSTATKILHTIYPEIIPMIDNPLQRKYKKEINYSWTYKKLMKF